MTAELMPTTAELIAIKRLGATELTEGTRTDFALRADEVVDAAEIHARANGLAGGAPEHTLAAGLIAGNTLIGLVYGISRACADCHDGMVECDLGHRHECPECDGTGYTDGDVHELLNRLASGTADDDYDERAMDMHGIAIPAEEIARLLAAGVGVMTPADATRILRCWRDHRRQAEEAAA